MNTLAATALALGLTMAAIPAAMADDVALVRPLAGATLTSGDVALSVYYVDLADGGFEVVATYIGDRDGEHARRIVMKLSDGEATRFGLPGHPGVLFDFSRRANVVLIKTDEVKPRGSLAPVAAAG